MMKLSDRLLDWWTDISPTQRLRWTVSAASALIPYIGWSFAMFDLVDIFTTIHGRVFFIVGTPLTFIASYTYPGFYESH